MFLVKRSRGGAKLRITNSVLATAACACVVFFYGSTASAAISSAGDIAPVPPAGGGNVVGPFVIGDVDVGTMNISSGTALTSTSAAIVGDSITGLGIVTMSGFLSDWTLTSLGADLTVGSQGTGSVSVANLAFLSVNDDLFIAAQLDGLGEMSISGLGSIVDVGDDANIAQRGQANVDIFDGGRLVTDANIVGDEAASDGRITVSDQLSLWRATSSIVIADAGRALMQVFDGARVENTSGIIANLAGSTGTAEVVGLGSLWQNSLGLVIGESGNGTLIIADGGRVTTGGGGNLATIGRQIGAIGQVAVRGVDSFLSVSMFKVGDSGDGSLRILEGGRVTSGTTILGDNATGRGEAIVEGAGSIWQVTGELTVSDPGEAQLTIANSGLVRSSSLTRVAALGRLTLDGGRLEIGGTTALLNTGVVEGNGVIEGLFLNNNAGGQLRPHGSDSLVLIGTLTNAGLVDVQSGELEVIGPTINNSDIDARDGAIFRFRGTGLDNNSGAQLAITSGIVDVFGAVDNNLSATIAVGGSALAVFHDPVTNNGTLFIQPGGEAFMLENLGFGAGSSLSLQLREVDLTQPDTETSDAFGQVQVAGSAAIAGTLEVELVGGYMPMSGDSFQILTAGGGRSGVFGSEILPSLTGGLAWDVQYNAESVVLAVISASLPGDFNLDGTVDAADYVVWRKGVGVATTPENYNLWRTNFGQPTGGGSEITPYSNSTVPEPTSALLLIFGAVAGANMRGRFTL